MFTRAIKGIIAASALTIAIAAPAQASPIALDGSWTILDDIVSTGDFFTGTGSGAPTIGTATSFDWTSPFKVLFRLTDLYVVGDQYRVFDNGKKVGDVTNGVQWQDISGCQGLHDADCHWTGDPDAAWADVSFAKDQFLFAPGSHSITIQVLNIPDFSGPLGGQNPKYFDATTALSATAIPTPEPTSLMLLGSGLTAVAMRARRRRHSA